MVELTTARFRAPLPAVSTMGRGCKNTPPSHQKSYSTDTVKSAAVTLTMVLSQPGITCNIKFLPIFRVCAYCFYLNLVTTQGCRFKRHRHFLNPRLPLIFIIRISLKVFKRHKILNAEGKLTKSGNATKHAKHFACFVSKIACFVYAISDLWLHLDKTLDPNFTHSHSA